MEHSSVLYSDSNCDPHYCAVYLVGQYGLSLVLHYCYYVIIIAIKCKKNLLFITPVNGNIIHMKQEKLGEGDNTLQHVSSKLISTKVLPFLSNFWYFMCVISYSF